MVPTLIAGYKHEDHKVDYNVTIFPYFTECKAAVEKL